MNTEILMTDTQTMRTLDIRSAEMTSALSARNSRKLGRETNILYLTDTNSAMTQEVAVPTSEGCLLEKEENV